MGQIHLVRHGQASFDADDYDCLSALGERQSRLLGEWFGRCNRAVHALHRGTLKRHRQTAEGFLEALPAALRPAGMAEPDAGFDEFDHDAMLLAARPDFRAPGAMRAWLREQPRPRRAFQQLFAEAMARWMSGAHDADYTLGWPAFRLRCVAALERALASAEDGHSMLVVTSGGPISAICQHLLGLADDKAAQVCFGLVNSGVTRISFSGARLHLAQLNSAAHLEVTADPGLVSYR